MDARLQQRDDAGLADVLPGQAKHQGVELSVTCSGFPRQ
jgi:hypothetical protein